MEIGGEKARLLAHAEYSAATSRTQSARHDGQYWKSRDEQCIIEDSRFTTVQHFLRPSGPPTNTSQRIRYKIGED